MRCMHPVKHHFKCFEQAYTNYAPVLLEEIVIFINSSKITKQ